MCSTKKPFDVMWDSILTGEFVDETRTLKNRKSHRVTYSDKDILIDDIVLFDMRDRTLLIFGEAMKYCDGKNHVTMIVDMLSDRLGLSRGVVISSLRWLVAKGFLQRLTKEVYLVNPDYIWRGDIKSRLIALERYEMMLERYK